MSVKQKIHQRQNIFPFRKYLEIPTMSLTTYDILLIGTLSPKIYQGSLSTLSSPGSGEIDGLRNKQGTTRCLPAGSLSSVSPWPSCKAFVFLEYSWPARLQNSLFLSWEFCPLWAPSWPASSPLVRRTWMSSSPKNVSQTFLLRYQLPLHIPCPSPLL